MVLKLFPDNVSLFYVVNNEDKSTSELTDELRIYKWKISLNPDPLNLLVKLNFLGTALQLIIQTRIFINIFKKICFICLKNEK